MLELILNGVTYGSMLFLISAGLTMIFSIMGIINITHGCMYMLGAYIAASLILQYSGSIGMPYASFIAAPLLVALIGIAIERGFIRLIYKRPLIYQLLLTFALVYILQDTVRLIWGTSPIRAYAPYIMFGTTRILNVDYPNYNFFIILVSGLCGAILLLFLHKTRYGMLIRATSMDPEMASALGVNIRNVYIAVFAIGSFFAGLSGALMAPVITAVLGIDAEALISAFVVVILGGIGSIKGAFIGAMIIGIARSLSITFFPEAELAIIYLVMAIVLLIRPSGLFGKRIE